MRAASDAVLLRIFVGEEDRHSGRATYEALVAKALEHKLAGATVLHAPEGFGRSRYVRSERNVDSGACAPMVVEIVDTEDRINAFVSVVSDMIESGIMTLEKVRAFRSRRPDPS
ncbi:MAG TPA: DUF190 domain-containing protein [Stellaceae bacterium]|nr:DUF190 domain-containing protein [Stellaceae bacterium]